MGERAERFAMNEAWFREMNDQIEADALKHGSDTDVFEFVCECASLDCAERMQMTLAQYERVRSDPTHFAVLPGHDLPEIENVILRDGFWIVAKKGRAAGMVAERD